MAGRLIAMWSGPRNISTALMRSFGNRPDTDVVDEPLYGHYLATTGVDHPGREEILASMPTDWRKVVAGLTRAPADGRIFYQKHMTHHVTPDVGLDWIIPFDNCFLLRDPKEVVRSYRAKRDGAALSDLGFEQQVRIFDFVVARTGRVPPVVDARDILENPRRTLFAICDALRIDFREEMLSWPAGRRDTDGVWARHWYDAVERSTGFAPYLPATEPLDRAGRALADACLPFYEKLRAHGIGS